MNNNSKNNLDRILGDLTIYQDPDLLKDEYKKIINVSEINYLNLKKYFECLMNIQYAFKKTSRYSLYFKDFYTTSSKISNVEALKHHIHSYLEDVDILRNKIEVFLGILKNDIKNTLSEKFEKQKVELFFTEGITSTKKVFEGVTTHRNPHHHKGKIFMDSELLEAENKINFSQILKEPNFNRMLKQDILPQLIEKLKKEEQSLFDSAKNRWIKNAEKNDYQISGAINSLFEIIGPSLYEFLKIKPLKDILEV